MDFEKYEYNREQKKAYNTFTKEALIDLVISKNEQIAEQQKKILHLQNVSNNEVAVCVHPYSKLWNKWDGTMTVCECGEVIEQTDC